MGKINGQLAPKTIIAIALSLLIAVALIPFTNKLGNNQLLIIIPAFLISLGIWLIMVKNFIPNFLSFINLEYWGTSPSLKGLWFLNLIDAMNDPDYFKKKNLVNKSSRIKNSVLGITLLFVGFACIWFLIWANYKII